MTLNKTDAETLRAISEKRRQKLLGDANTRMKMVGLTENEVSAQPKQKNQTPKSPEPQSNNSFTSKKPTTNQIKMSSAGLINLSINLVEVMIALTAGFLARREFITGYAAPNYFYYSPVTLLLFFEFIRVFCLTTYAKIPVSLSSVDIIFNLVPQLQTYRQKLLFLFKLFFVLKDEIYYFAGFFITYEIAFILMAILYKLQLVKL